MLSGTPSVIRPELLVRVRTMHRHFFDHLLRIGDDGKYQPGLALRWDTSADGKAITFKPRRGVKFHDGTPFNAQAVKSNIDNLIPPEGPIILGITSVEIVDDYTLRPNLSDQWRILAAFPQKFNNGRTL